MLDSTKIDPLFDRAVEDIRNARPDEKVVREAADRVWKRLGESKSAGLGASAEVAEIRDCDDYQALIPSKLAGTLSPARKTLLDDHLRSCVPCRRALKAARAGETPDASPTHRSMDMPRTATPRPWGRWLMAAMLAVGLGLGAMLAWQSMPFASGPTATVAAVDGELFRVAAGTLPVETGAPIKEGERLRSGRNGGAVVTLRDGSQIEMRARSEISIDEKRSGTTIQLARGSVIVQAADQRERHLYVATDDCLVSVTGTIFSVNSGTKGSRVSVIEGQVVVDFGGEETVLEPGDQVTTTDTLAAMPLADELAWSRDVDRWISLLGEIQALGRAISDAVGTAELRFGSRLLDVMPTGTVVYAGVPNLSETIGESYRAAMARLQESPVLHEWWQRNHGPDRLQPAVDFMIERVENLGSQIGDEVAIAIFRENGAVVAPVLAAEVEPGVDIERYMLEEIDQFITGAEPLVFLDEELNAADATGDAFYAWTHDGILLASMSPDSIRRIARGILDERVSGFVGTPFHQEVAARYAEGTGILAAFDIESVVRSETRQASADERRAFSVFGLDNARHVIFERKGVEGRRHNQVALSFRDSRQGISSWLAAPAPLGSLDFISPDAKLFTAMVIKNPAQMLDDVSEALAGDTEASASFTGALLDFQQEYGMDLRNDIAAVIGGEVAFAVDGPMLPIPSWKLIVEVYDPARLQWVLEQAIERANVQRVEAGKNPFELTQEQVGGRTFYTLPAYLGEIHYTFVDGYMVSAASRALVDRAIRFRDSGYTIVTSPQFTSLLPHDRYENFSAVFFQDFGKLVDAALQTLAPLGLNDDQAAAVDAIKSGAEPMLAFAYGDEDRIVAALTSDQSLLGNALFGLFGWLGPNGFDRTLENAIQIP